MTKPAFRATFLTARPVPSRGVVTFSFDVPTEEASAALALLGGFPVGGSSVWVGIAPLAPEAKAKPAPKERYQQLNDGEQAVARAGVLCNDNAFCEWANKQARAIMTRDGVVDWMRAECGVKSRADIATDPEALKRFLAMETAYRFGDLANR